MCGAHTTSVRLTSSGASHNDHTWEGAGSTEKRVFQSSLEYILICTLYCKAMPLSLQQAINDLKKSFQF